MLGAVLFGFLTGVVGLVAAECFALLWLLRRLRWKRPAADVPSAQAVVRDLVEEQLLTYPDEKKVSDSFDLFFSSFFLQVIREGTDLAGA